MPTRIEKLGELYDLAIERIADRQRGYGGDKHFSSVEESDMYRQHNLAAHEMDMDIVRAYLAETKRPEQPSIPDRLRILGERFADLSTMTQAHQNQVLNLFKDILAAEMGAGTGSPRA